METVFYFVVVVLLAGLLGSCVTGNYMELKSKDQVEVLGTIQSTFYVNGAFRYRNTINRQAYINLMAEAQEKYPGENVDIRDISWVIGRQTDSASNNYEYNAIGKVIRR